MTRLFVALSLPAEIRARLSFLRSGIPGARWLEPQSFHVTLRFIGEVDSRVQADIRGALAAISGKAFPLILEGVGQFGDKKPHALWAGVRQSEPLTRLAGKIDQRLQRLRLTAETRRFTPHVMLARLKDVAPARVADFLAQHSLFRAEPFIVDEFILYSSHLGHEGAHYRPEALYALDAA